MTPGTAPADPTEIFKALGDPIRWNIVRQMAEVDELACSTLEDTLPVWKPTISYHAKILVQAGLVQVRKDGRNYYYTLRRDVLHALMNDIRALAPAPRPVRETGRRVVKCHVASTTAETGDKEAVLLTW